MGFVYLINGVIGGHKVTYCGSTTRHVQTRYAEHVAGKSTYTSKMKNKRLVFWMEVPNLNVRAVEYHIKKRRRVKFALKGRKKHAGALENFQGWLADHDIPVTDAWPDKWRGLVTVES